MTTPQQQVTHRNGQSGTMSAPDSNGFARFVSTTGARYSVHQSEVTWPDMTAKERAARVALWDSWPDGTLRFKVERPDGAVSPVFIVARTPVPMVQS